MPLFNSSSDVMYYCIQSLALRARALPIYNPKNGIGNLTTDSEFTFTETEPFTDGYYYLLVVSESRVSFKLAVTTTGKKILCKNIFDTFCSNAGPFYKLTSLSVGHWCYLYIYIIISHPSVCPTLFLPSSHSLLWWWRQQASLKCQ
jgi:hypothetical protein